MTAYIITYDLMSPGKNYAPLHEEIKALGTWAKCLESTWLVASSLDAPTIRDRLQRRVDANDKIMVVGLGTTWATTNVGESCVAWLRKYVQA